MGTHNYDAPFAFQELSQTPLAGRIWEYLNGANIINALEIAAGLEVPSVAALFTIRQDLGDEALTDQCKRMIGSMVRQILERRGWKIVSGPDGAPGSFRTRIKGCDFKSGARYKKPTGVESQTPPGLQRSQEIHARLKGQPAA